MKRIQGPSLKDLFQYSKDLRDVTKFHEEFKVYNAFTFLVLMGLFLIVVGVYKRECFLLGLTLLSSLGVTYLGLRKLSRGIFIKRTGPKRGQEYDKITFQYQIQNNTGFNLNHYILKDHFTGNQLGYFYKDSPLRIGPHKVSELSHTFIGDGGMGEKESLNLQLIIKDPLDLIEFTIMEDKVDPFELYPLIEKIIPIENRFNQFSYHFGEIDVPSRGDSTNFFGTRSYRPGDPVKRINWRLSAKTNKTIVNIFEKNINKSFTLLFNTDQRLHSGMGGLSTEEYLKDFILAIASQNITNGNDVEVITNKMKSPSGSGKSFINRLELFLYDLPLVQDNQAAQFVENFLKRSDDWEKRERSLIYFTPIVPGPLFERNIETIIKLKDSGKEVEIVWVDAFPFIDRHLRYAGNISVKHQMVVVKERTTYWKEICRVKDIPCYHLVIKEEEKFTQSVKAAHLNMWRTL
ncbi:MAG: DUF58 domain-containing protein [Bacteriovoracaceae bacterium]|nr:DUF58 domain-containing protein [Bacteriovoracaceae bacterium]